MATVCYNKAQLALRNRFRLLWEQHVYWTRMTILGIAFDSPDLNATVERLLRNVPDFETTLGRFYTTEETKAFGKLLQDHLLIAAELVNAAKAGDSNAVADIEKRWYASADEIVLLMQQMNPYWPVKIMKPMWYNHLALTENEAVYTLKGQHKKSIDTFDIIEKLAMEMADSFSKGIIKQFKI